MLCGQKQKRSFHSFRVKVALLRYIVFYYESGCDTSEPHASYISRVCSSLVCQSYYIPNRFILKIRGLVVVLTVRKVHWAGRVFYMDEYTLIFLFLTVHKVCTKARLLGERSVRIREVKGSNPSRSTFSSSVILTLLLFFCVHISQTLALGPGRIRTARPRRRQGKQSAQWAVASCAGPNQ